MPWECRPCQVELDDDVPTCPGCGGAKDAWTLVADNTRAFVVSSKRPQALVGVGEERVAAEEGYPADVEWVAAEAAPVVQAVLACWAALDGFLPPPRCVVSLSVPGGEAKKRTVTVSVLYETRDVVAHELEQPASEAPTDLRLLFVFGLPEGAEPPRLEGLHVIDLSEEAGAGYAPEVRLRVGAKRAEALPTSGPPAGSVWLRLVSGARRPVVGARCTLLDTGRAPLTSDEEGGVRWTGLRPAAYRVRVEVERGEAFELGAPWLRREEAPHEVLLPGLDRRAAAGGGGEAPPLGCVWVRLLDPAYRPLCDVSCTLRDGAGDEVGRLTSDDAGEVFADGLDLAAYTLELELPGGPVEHGVPWLRARDGVHELMLLGPAPAPGVLS